MKTSNFRLLVLVPHRDARLPLRAWSASLFAAGYPGAWSFPWLAPLALLKRPLSAEELKRLAHALRRQLNSEGGKFIAKQSSLCALPAEFPEGRAAFVYGPTLDAGLGDDFYEPVADAISSRISPLVLGTALVREADKVPSPTDPTSSTPQIAFRAAALANMSYIPLQSSGVQSGYSFEWKLGPLHWLPKNAEPF
jgi:hypothetical protein